MSQLLPCPGCGRHVRRTESACPFCASTIAFAPAPVSRVPAERLGRAAIMAFGAAAATTVAACAPVPAYGAPAPDDAGQIDGGPIEEDAGGGVDAAYGGPPFDAGADAGGPTPAYGAPPDAGEADSGGGAIPAYGAPGTD